MIDLRSDTVTLPTVDMKTAMINAPLGDDVFGEDPSINELERYTANLFGMEAAMYCPSGTMTNQIALNVHLSPGDEVICHHESHIYQYEGGGIAKNSGASVRLMHGNSGLLSAQDVLDNINPDNVHFARTALVSLENTMNRGGGVCYDMAEMEAIKKVCQEHNLPLHLDGARVFNAIVKNGESPKEYGQVFDSISICLSKGLGAPVGSVLLGTNAFMKQAKRVRKVFGGGMRQAGMIAKAGWFALNHHVDRLQEDHDHALQIEALLKTCAWVNLVEPVATNIIVFEVDNPSEILAKLKEKGVLAIGFGGNKLRMVTHLNISPSDVDQLAGILATM
ncbi:MAG: threonine aldolase [Flavobacteriales bacterium]|jgi:threonine aldolase